jgi:tetratricopeptide (TPR) repeat protein
MNQDQELTTKAPGMARKKLLLLLALLLVAASVWLLLPRAEPSYLGKPLSYWLKRHLQYAGQRSDPNYIESKEAIQRIGTNAIPMLLKMLDSKDSAIKEKLSEWLREHDLMHLEFADAFDRIMLAQDGFTCLERIPTNYIPALVNICRNGRSAMARNAANTILSERYLDAGVREPYWLPQESRSRWYLQAGAFKLESKAYSNAILAFSQSINLDPSNSSAYLARGSAEVQIHDFATAGKDAKRALELDSNSIGAITITGYCKFALKDFQGAVTDFTRAIAMDTNDCSSYNGRGLAKANLRKLDDAMDDFNRAAALSYADATVYRNRAMVETLQREYERALEDVSKSIQMDNHDGSAFYLRGQIKNALKDYREALADFDEAISLSPQNPGAYAARAGSYMYLDDFQKSEADLEKARQLNPDLPLACVVRAYIGAKQGDFDTMLANMQRAVELSPKSAEYYALLGFFQYLASRRAEALESCQKALSMGMLAESEDLRAYIWLIRAQSGERPEANKELETFLNSQQGPNTNAWAASIARYFSGHLEEGKFLDQATSTARRPSAVRPQVTESYFYAAMKHKLDGDEHGALQFLTKCLDTKNTNNLAYMNAGLEMRTLKKD